MEKVSSEIKDLLENRLCAYDILAEASIVNLKLSQLFEQAIRK